MMSDRQTEKSRATLFDQRGIPPLGQAFPMALQHVVAMIVGCVTPAIIVSNVAGLSQPDRVMLIQASLIIAAICTLIQNFPIGRQGGFRLGSGLPMILGVSFAYVPSLQAIAALPDGLAAIAGSMIVGGIVAILVGIFIKRIRRLFPALITGTVVFTIGLSLYPTAINYMAGGVGSPMFGAWQNWLVALFTLGVVVTLSHFTKGIAKLASILLGMVAGYILAACMGMVNFSSVGQAGAFALPLPLHFGIRFDLASCIAMGLLFAINSIQAIGDFTATTVGGLGREPTDDELESGIVCYGATNLISAFFCGLPTATYSQNVGIVSTTKVVNRTVMALASAIILLAGLFPKFSAILTTIPQCVLGGATITVFSSIAMTGIKLITREKMDARNTAIVGLSVALGVGISQVPTALAQFPESFTMIFGKSPVVVTTLVALLLNQILPREAKNDVIKSDIK